MSLEVEMTGRTVDEAKSAGEELEALTEFDLFRDVLDIYEPQIQAYLDLKKKPPAAMASAVLAVLDALDEILGKRTDQELAAAIKQTICEDPDVHGAFDLYLYNYGPDQNYGSVHVEVNDTMTANEIDAMDRRIQARVYMEHGVILTGIGLYSINTQNDEAGEMRRRIMETVMAHDYAMQFHGFYVDMEKKHVTFDVVFSFECDRDAALREVSEEVKVMYPGYTFVVQPDIDIA